ncbi:MAG: glycosyltransferase family 4 protein [Dehalococcoidia bacterium]|nr:glycosyltransferase family 4 protein [Dehalococcoidia bacterium]
MKLAFVTPWYGPHPIGGAEVEAKGTVENLHRRGLPVEVLTTCVEDFRADWDVNHYPEGRTSVNGVPVTRFRVDSRDGPLFAQVNKRLMRGEPITPAEEEVFVGESIRSRRMEEHIAERRGEYRFVFIPYMFGTTYWGTQVAPQDSFLIPCLHDEIYARLSVFRPMFQRVKRVLFHTRAERELARSFYGLPSEQSLLIGEGVDTEVQGEGEAFRQRFGVADPFLLYVGRKDAGKNVAELVDFFGRYKARRQGSLKLVILGAGSLELPESLRGEVIDLGFVSGQDKYNAYCAAQVLWQPSLNESFSLVLMESWLCGAPVLVNARCGATVEQCLASNGGLFYQDYPEFEACVDWFMAQPQAGKRMAQLGREYVQRNFHWERIVVRLESALFS